MPRRSEGFSSISSYLAKIKRLQPRLPRLYLGEYLVALMDSIYQFIPGVSPKRSPYISYERKLSNPSATPYVEARKVRVPTAYMMLKKSKGNLDHCSRGLRRTCKHCCRTHHKSSSAVHQVCTVDFLQEIRNHL